MIGSLIKLLPEGLSLPRTEFRLELRVELMEIGGLNFEQIAEVTKVAKNRLEGGGIAELVEDLASEGHLRRRHLLPTLLVV